MWTNTFLSHLSKVAGGGESSKKGPAVRYSAIPSDSGAFLRGPQIFLDLDVEDTVTCFCRFVRDIGFSFCLLFTYTFVIRDKIFVFV